MNKALERALARHAAVMERAKPTAESAYKALIAGEAINGEIPEHAGDLPEGYPYNALSESQARQLAFITAALPEKAAEIQGLFLLIP